MQNVSYNPLTDDRATPRPPASEAFNLTYAYYGDDDPRAVAEAIGVEQSIEFPLPYVRSAAILEHVVPQCLSIDPHPAQAFCRIVLSYNPAVAGPDLVQCLNVLFGNIGMKEDIKLIGIEIPAGMMHGRGPRFGVSGIRSLTGVGPEAPVLASALKPMGLSPRALAHVAADFVSRGIHVIKDDHGISDQAFAPFDERVRAVGEAIGNANARHGMRTLYAPNLSAPIDMLFDRAHMAKEAGAGALMIAPGLVGFDVIRALRADNSLNLPILAHPSFLGPLALNPRQGLSYGITFGWLPRFAGADITIFPNHGGRFAFAQADCHSIFDAALTQAMPCLPCLPSPAGGMRTDKIPAIQADYGTADFMALIGGDMYAKWA
ncbi:MAG: RuBisCO large subunit C-terminal-like domain-containing protein [Proteobacteria bacterium]|nr:RuBisCO large subunit C-terminal-like domain-containing protein [Pseudomonadota bacterium]